MTMQEKLDRVDPSRESFLERSWGIIKKMLKGSSAEKNEVNIQYAYVDWFAELQLEEVELRAGACGATR